MASKYYSRKVTKDGVTFDSVKEYRRFCELSLLERAGAIADLKRQLPVNEQENAQVELIDAQRRAAEITTLLNLATKLDNETLMQQICEQLDLDYNDLKDKLPDPEENPKETQSVLDAIVTEGPDGGDMIE